MVDMMIQTLQTIDPIWIHLFLILSTFLENVFPPWPGDTFIVFSGFLMYHQIIHPFTTVFSTTFGNFLGAYTMYFLGKSILDFAHKIHKEIKIRWIAHILESMISPEQMRTTELWFQKWGFWFIFVSRFSAGIRYFVSIVAGITKMNLFLFSFAFLVGILIWNFLLFSGGYLLAENWKQVLEWLKMYNLIVGMIITLLIIFIVYKIYKKKQKIS